MNPVISISNLRKRFNLEAGFFARLGRYVHAVNGVSLQIGRNESYGLVGESGCGKTTTARLMVRMYEADEGEIMFQGSEGAPLNVRKLKGKEFKSYREKVKYVFQDPARSLNPRMTIYEVLTSGARWSTTRQPAAKLREDAAAILEEVGLSAEDLERRPAEFSGGQRQRISIARSLLMKPDLLICDEVVSALDVSIQGQILNLLLDLRERRDLSLLFIAHDLKVASYFCDRIGVMYRGEIMEEAPAETLWKNHRHPYTELLFLSVGNVSENTAHKESRNTKGEPGNFPPSESRTALERSTTSVTKGCAFASRCPHVGVLCLKAKPELKQVDENHYVRCRRQVKQGTEKKE